MQTKERKNRHDDHDQANEINYAIHDVVSGQAAPMPRNNPLT
jgi:hypothetical protein